ncbi:hypothetical protein JAO73_01515 [Hymenobacter sp. BT523]|uniref:hypothetical protein n=1 Tax=Hymenobacter sp. BT523 TaxID=2795725 RepID=UPI0018EBA67F|nr:hypothetical protein [Hymenobacter sp. BT523]MBJ6107671.1 hypothetical protein [Hymenobacter sp. BT523]
MRQYSLPSDALPAEVGDAYESLLHALSDWLSAPSPFTSTNLADYFEEHLAGCDTPETRIRYLCRLTLHGGVNGEAYPEAAMDLVELQAEFRAFPGYTDTDLDLYFDEYYFSWLAVRLTEALCEYTGRARLRGARASLRAEWEALPLTRLQYRPTDANTVQLLRFLFVVLIPFAQNSRTRSVRSVTEEVVQGARAANKPQRPAPVPLSSNVATLCSGNFKPTDLRALLTSLGVLDATTGQWHLGELKGKAAAPLSAFPAAYRALFEAKLMLFADAPVYRKAFEEEFHVKFSDRLATFKDGSGSARFQDYLVEARRWITVWKASDSHITHSSAP